MQSFNNRIKINKLENNKIETRRLINFLVQIDNEFHIPLSSTSDLNKYAAKILKLGIVIVAEEEDEIIGAVLGYANNFETKNAYISTFGVLERYRNYGLGTQLLSFLKKMARSKGMNTISVHTNINNHGAAKFYIKNNFSIKEEKNEQNIYLISNLKENNSNADKVLVTAIGSFSADIVIKTLDSMGFDIIGCDIYQKEWVADAYNVDEFYKAPLVTNEEEYIKFIDRICSKHNIKYIFPLTDPEVDLLSKEKTRLESQGIKVCTSSEESIKLSRDKFNLPNFLSENGFKNIIATKLMSEVNTIDSKVFIKPVFGRSSQGARVVHTAEEFAYLKKQLNTKDYIVQPVIQGNIITVDVIRNPENNTVISISRRELLRNDSGAGTTVEVFENQELHTICKEIVEELNIIGATNIEFFETSDGEYYFIELNPRLSGGVEFSHLAGYNVIKNHLNCFTGKEIDTETKIQSMIIARKYEEYITAYL